MHGTGSGNNPQRQQDHNQDPTQDFGPKGVLHIPHNDQITTTGNQISQQDYERTSQQIPHTGNIIHATSHSSSRPKDCNQGYQSKEKGGWYISCLVDVVVSLSASCCYPSVGNMGSCKFSGVSLMSLPILRVVASPGVEAGVVVVVVVAVPIYIVLIERNKILRAGMTIMGKVNVIVKAKHMRPTINSGSSCSKANMILP
jgi:hypothetical protein